MKLQTLIDILQNIMDQSTDPNIEIQVYVPDQGPWGADYDVTDAMWVDVNHQSTMIMVKPRTY
jgi:hypothetical protein